MYQTTAHCQHTGERSMKYKLLNHEDHNFWHGDMFFDELPKIGEILETSMLDVVKVVSIDEDKKVIYVDS
jgi:hypothetical protein